MATSSRSSSALAALASAVAISGAILAGCATPSAGTAPSAVASTASSNSHAETVVGQISSRMPWQRDDIKSLDTLAADYLQKVRDKGDPAYYPKIEAALTQALSLDSNDADALTMMGMLSLSRHQFKDALSWGKKARASNPYASTSLGVIGDAQIEMGQYPDAIATFQKMVDLRPDLSSYARVSYARELHGDVPGAIDAMQMAIVAGGPAAENVAYPQVILGNLYFDSGRLDQAEAAYAQALVDYPNYVPAQGGLARVQAARGNYDDAIKRYQRVVDVYPAPEYAIALGDVYTVTGSSKKALDAYDLAAAEQKLYQANGIDVDAELALFQADQRRDLSSALDAARRAIRDRGSVVSADTLAWTLYQNGDYSEARQASDQAHRLGTRYALFFFHSGMIKYRTGDLDGARSDLTEALSINPYFSLIHVAEARSTLAALGEGSGVQTIANPNSASLLGGSR